MNTLKTFFYSLKKSLFDFKYYNDVKRATFGFSLKYLWFLIFILVFVKAVGLTGAYIYSRPQITPAVNRFVSYAQDFYPEELELNIMDGQLSTNVEEPYIFELNKDVKGMEEDKRHFLIIDTQGSIENYPQYNTYVLATRNAVVYPSKSESNRIQETSVFYFRDLKQDITVNRAVYDGIIEKAKPYAGRAVYFVDWFVSVALALFLVFGSVFMTAGILMGLLLLTVIVWIVSKLMKKTHSFGELYRMGMHAVTWPIIFSEVTKILNLGLPNVYGLVFLVFMIMVLMKMGDRKVAAVAARKAPAPKTRKKSK